MDATLAPAPASTAVLHFQPPVARRDLPPVNPLLLQAQGRGLMVEYTSRCNLRCRYCTKSNPGDDDIPGRNMDMLPQTLDETLAFIASQRLSELLLAGTGESTFHPNWVQDLPRLIAAGKAANPQCYVHLNTNLALRYADAEFAVLAQLDGLVVSIDTADRDLTRQVRAKSDLALIGHNMMALKAWCDLRGQRPPRIIVNATVYAQAARGLHELLVYLSQLPVDRVSIADMVEVEACKVNGVRPINIDDRAAFVESVQSLQKAIHFGQQQKKFQLDVQPHLFERVNALVAQFNSGAAASAGVTDAGAITPPGRTKLCLQPWTRFTVAANGALFPCCVTDMPPVGHIGIEGQGIDGPAIRDFRHRMLVGQLPSPCVACTNGPSADPAALQAAVAGLLRVAH
jgi:hypothetical protein